MFFRKRLHSPLDYETMKLPEKGPDKMLKGKNVVVIKGDKDSPAIVTEYDRIYLENSSTDELEEYSKTSEGKDLLVDGKVWKGRKPKEQTKANPEDLVPEALAFFQSEYPVDSKTLEGKTDEEQAAITSRSAWLLLLEAASYGADLWKRNKIQADVRPPKPISEAAAIDKAVKLVMSLNPKLTREKAIEVAKAMAAAAA